MATAPATAYPTLVPTPVVGGGIGLPTNPRQVKSFGVPTDALIPGAIVLSPPQAPFFLPGGYTIEAPRNNANNAPPVPPSKTVSQDQAASQSPSYWDSKPWAAMDPRILFGIGKKAQKPMAHPWVKKFIPPLALFNDASQWVNTLFYVHPMKASGNGNSMPDVTGVYLGSQPTPPIMTNNFAAGGLNVQLQLGTIAIQAQQLTMSASNYFGGT